MKKIIAVLTSISLATSASALFCPKSFNQVNIGDTIDQVQQKCGKADEEKKIKTDDNVPQEWTFYITPQMNNYTAMRTHSVQNASVKMSIGLKEGKVANITVNGMSLAATTLCSPGISTSQTQDASKNIAIGDTANSVKKACGNPSAVSKSSSEDENDQKPDKIIELRYNTSPPTTLTFKNGILQSIT